MRLPYILAPPAYAEFSYFFLYVCTWGIVAFIIHTVVFCKWEMLNQLRCHQKYLFQLYLDMYFAHKCNYWVVCSLQLGEKIKKNFELFKGQFSSQATHIEPQK